MSDRETLRIGNAPVSYGVFGDIDVEGATTPRSLLQTMSAAGYEGSELGPPGFFGNTKEMAAAFADSGLTGIGTYVPLHTQDRGSVLERDLARMRQSLREVAAINPKGLIILADEGSAELLAHPCHTAEHALTAEGWDRLVSVVESAVREIHDAGLTPSFHPHISTYVENPHEIEQLLERTSIDLTYDVAHVVMGGGEAISHYRSWEQRINHIHVKDVKLSVLSEAVRSGRIDFDVWWEDLCTPLGEGDLDVAAFVDEVVLRKWSGWLVVEQDRAPVNRDTVNQAIADQTHNQSWLTHRVSP